MSQEFNNMEAMEDFAYGSSNLATAATLLLSIAAGTLVAVDASVLDGLSTRVA